MNPERAGRRAFVCLVRKWSALRANHKTFVSFRDPLRPIEPLIAIVLDRLGGSASPLSMGRFLLGLGPLVATQRRRPFLLCPPPIVFRILWGTEQSAGQVCPRLHFYVVLWTHCRCEISSSPPRLRLLSVTESVALPPDPWSASHAGMAFPSHDRAISLSQVRNSHDAGRCRARRCWSRFTHACMP
jgi:hypothetical protein